MLPLQRELEVALRSAPGCKFVCARSVGSHFRGGGGESLRLALAAEGGTSWVCGNQRGPFEFYAHGLCFLVLHKSGVFDFADFAAEGAI